MKLFIGIDPGLSGAIAALSRAGDIFKIWDMPSVKIGRSGQVDVYQLSVILAGFKNAKVLVEQQQSMPKAGVQSSFNHGRNTGQLLATLDLSRLPWSEVRANIWKKKMGVTNDKKSALALARRLWPAFEGRHDRAEALLLAEYLRRSEVRL